MIGAIALDKPGASRPDVGRYGQAELESLGKLVAALFRLEGSRSVDDVRRVLEALIDWLKEPEQEGLRRAFVVWFKRVLEAATLEEVFNERFYVLRFKF